MSESAEIWAPVESYEGLYEISDLGRIRSFHKNWRGRVLKAPPNMHGYRCVTLWRWPNSHKTAPLHQLVARAFIGPRPAGFHTRHMNGNKLDNAASNLAYGTGSENVLDSVRHGTQRQVRKTHCPKGHEYTPENVSRDRLGRRSCRTCHGAKDLFSIPKRDRTHCIAGHEFTAENTLIRPNGTRSCRTCRRERGRAWRKANPEQTKILQQRADHKRQGRYHQP